MASRQRNDCLDVIFFPQSQDGILISKPVILIDCSTGMGHMSPIDEESVFVATGLKPQGQGPSGRTVILVQLTGLWDPIVK
jgi:hypothetical protein